MKQACTIGQGFGGNATETYQQGGLLGHTGIDNFCGYGTPIYAYHDEAYVYKVLTKENPSNDGTGFTGIFCIIDNGIEVFEFLYGHCDPSVKVGDIIKKGDLIGTEANNGEVYAGSGTKDSDFIRITLAMQKAGDHRGAHRHDQKRILKKVKNWNSKDHFLSDVNASYFKDGYYYMIPYYNNGYNGCVNWLLPIFNRDLFLGCTGYDVLCLQNFLKARGHLQIDETTTYFGTKTLSAVSAFQRSNGLSPIAGYCGVKTRTLINNQLQ